MQTKAASIAKRTDIASFLGVSLYNARATAAPADTINASPEGKPKSLSGAIKKSTCGISGLGLATRSFAIIPIGMRISIEIAITVAVFLPVQPPKTNRSIITIGQKISLPYSDNQTIQLLSRWLCELLTYRNAVESALVIGELLALLSPTFVETSVAATTNKTSRTTEAPKYLFNGCLCP